MKATAFQGKVRLNKEWEHRWLAADELSSVLPKEYYDQVEDLLTVTREPLSPSPSQ